MPPHHTDMNTNMNVNIEIHNVHGRRASRAKRGERGGLERSGAEEAGDRGQHPKITHQRDKSSFEILQGVGEQN